MEDFVQIILIALVSIIPVIFSFTAWGRISAKPPLPLMIHKIVACIVLVGFFLLATYLNKWTLFGNSGYSFKAILDEKGRLEIEQNDYFRSTIIPRIKRKMEANRNCGLLVEIIPSGNYLTNFLSDQTITANYSAWSTSKEDGLRREIHRIIRDSFSLIDEGRFYYTLNLNVQKGQNVQKSKDRPGFYIVNLTFYKDKFLIGLSESERQFPESAPPIELEIRQKTQEELLEEALRHAEEDGTLDSLRYRDIQDSDDLDGDGGFNNLDDEEKDGG